MTVWFPLGRARYRGEGGGEEEEEEGGGRSKVERGRWEGEGRLLPLGRG